MVWPMQYRHSYYSINAAPDSRQLRLCIEQEAKYGPVEVFRFVIQPMSPFFIYLQLGAGDGGGELMRCIRTIRKSTTR